MTCASVLRGDPAAKPNPRVKPHTEGFILHIRPTFYHQAVTTLYPTFRLGFLSALLFLIESSPAIFLMVFYSPTPETAYQSISSFSVRSRSANSRATFTGWLPKGW